MLEKKSSQSGKDKKINLLIKFFNAILKYTQEENSVVKFKLNLKHFLITQTVYNITKLFKRYKISNLKKNDEKQMNDLITINLF